MEDEDVMVLDPQIQTMIINDSKDVKP